VNQDGAGFRFYSAMATAPDSDVLSGLASPQVWTQFASAGLPFVRVVATDDILLKTIVHELTLRGADPRAGSR
jgi:hypothetical protein